MTRYFVWYLVLVTSLVAATLAISLLVFRHLDFRLTYFGQLIIVPALQALVLMWYTERSVRPRVRMAVRSLWADPLVRTLLVIDLPLLAVGWIVREHHTLGFGGAATVHVAWIGTKTIAAGLFLCRAAATIDDASTGRRRLWIAILGVALLAFGAQAFRPWLAALSVLTLGGQSELIRALVVYCGIFAGGLALALRAAHALRPSRPAAALLVESSTAPSFVAAIVVALNWFQRGTTIEP